MGECRLWPSSSFLPEGRLFPGHARHIDGPEGKDDPDHGSSENIQRMMEVVTDPRQGDEESQYEQTKLEVWSDNLEQ